LKWNKNGGRMAMVNLFRLMSTATIFFQGGQPAKERVKIVEADFAKEDVKTLLYSG
jgi:hypothetical protein